MCEGSVANAFFLLYLRFVRNGLFIEIACPNESLATKANQGNQSSEALSTGLSPKRTPAGAREASTTVNVNA